MGVYSHLWLASSFIVPFLQYVVPHKELSSHSKKKKKKALLSFCAACKRITMPFFVYVHSYSKGAVNKAKLKLQEHHECQISSFELIEQKIGMFPASYVIQLILQNKQSKHAVQSRELAASHS